jgi:hypothetical protein
VVPVPAGARVVVQVEVQVQEPHQVDTASSNR